MRSSFKIYMCLLFCFQNVVGFPTTCKEIQPRIDKISCFLDYPLEFNKLREANLHKLK